MINEDMDSQLNVTIKNFMKPYGYNRIHQAEDVYNDIKIECNVAMKHVKVCTSHEVEFCTYEKNDNDDIKLSN